VNEDGKVDIATSSFEGDSVTLLLGRWHRALAQQAGRRSTLERWADSRRLVRLRSPGCKLQGAPRDRERLEASACIYIDGQYNVW